MNHGLNYDFYGYNSLSKSDKYGTVITTKHDQMTKKQKQNQKNLVF